MSTDIAIAYALTLAAAWRHDEYEYTVIGKTDQALQCRQSAIVLEQFARDLEDKARVAA